MKDKLWKKSMSLLLCILLSVAPCYASFAATIQDETGKTAQEGTTAAPEATTEDKKDEEDKKEDNKGEGTLQGKKGTVVSVGIKGGKNPVYNGKILDGDQFLDVTVKEEKAGNTIKDPSIRYIYYKYTDSSPKAPREVDYLKEPPLDSGKYWVEVYYKGDTGHKSAYSSPIIFSLEKVTPNVIFTTSMTEDTLIGDTIKLTVQLKLPGQEGTVDAPEGTIVFKENGKVLNEAIPFKDGKAVFNYVLPAYESNLSVTYVQSPLSWVVQNYKNATAEIKGVQGKKRDQAGMVISTTHKVYGSEPFQLELSGGEGTGGFLYQSSDTSVATVDGTGMITILHPGTTYITVTKAGDDTYKENSKTYELIVGKGENPGNIKKIVKKEVTNNSISVNVVEGQEYSIDGGKNWNTTGVFQKLKANKEYTVLTRLGETEYYAATSKTRYLKLKTEKQKLNKIDQEIEVNDDSKGPLGSLGGNKTSKVTTANKVGSGTSTGKGDKTRKVNTLGKEDGTVDDTEQSKSEEASTEQAEKTTEAAENAAELSTEEEGETAEKKRSSTATMKAGMSALIIALAALAYIYFGKRETNL